MQSPVQISSLSAAAIRAKRTRSGSRISRIAVASQSWQSGLLDECHAGLNGLAARSRSIGHPEPARRLADWAVNGRTGVCDISRLGTPKRAAPTGNSSIASPLVLRGDYFMTEHQTEKTTTEARAGVTRHGVRYVLVLSLTAPL
jgi:hypothetical protein